MGSCCCRGVDEIGGGIGAIQQELLDAGVDPATSVEASVAYLRGAGGGGTARHRGARELGAGLGGPWFRHPAPMDELAGHGRTTLRERHLVARTYARTCVRALQCARGR